MMGVRNSNVINILLEGYYINAPWLYGRLKEIIQPCHKVAVIAFSFRDTSVPSLSEWELYYGKKGRLYNGIVSGLMAYGIPENRISFVNYFTDTKETALQKIEAADILYFPGGLPDKTVERIDDFGLREAIVRHTGIIVGYSAGALIQLAEYHLSPDEDYPAFQYRKGLSLVDGFYLEVHYEGRNEQDASIQRVLDERNGFVYATSLMAGAILIHDGEIELLGNVKVFKE